MEEVSPLFVVKYFLSGFVLSCQDRLLQSAAPSYNDHKDKY